MAWEAAAGTAVLVFGGLLLLRLAYAGCGDQRRAVWEKHTIREVPLDRKVITQNDNLTK